MDKEVHPAAKHSSYLVAAANRLHMPTPTAFGSRIVFEQEV
jgi:hypothetical protein